MALLQVKIWKDLTQTEVELPERSADCSSAGRHQIISPCWLASSLPRSSVGRTVRLDLPPLITAAVAVAVAVSATRPCAGWREGSAAEWEAEKQEGSDGVDAKGGNVEMVIRIFCISIRIRT